MTARFVDENEAQETNSSGLLRLGLVIALIVAISVAMEATWVAVIAAILLMIMLHEFGHYVTAKWAGMKVTDFFLGFGPTLWSIKKGDTRYGVKAIPAGGFVRVIGMNNLDPIEDDEDESQTYRSKTYFQRLRFAIAGSFTHFLIAFVLLAVLLGAYGRYDYDADPTTSLGEVVPSLAGDGKPSPAAAAGLQEGDKIISIGSTPIKEWITAQRIIRNSPNQTLPVTVERDGRRFSLDLTPAESPASVLEDGEKPFGMVGVSPAAVKQHFSPPAAVWNAATELKSITTESAGALVGLFSKSSLSKYGDQVTQRGPADPSEESNRLVSPFGLPRVANAATKQGVPGVLSLLIQINIFVGVFNMIPLPPFDGGHIAVATYEAIRSKIRGRRYTMDMGKMLPLAYAMVFALVLMFATTSFLDIFHPLNLG